MTPAAGIALMMNNYLHDVATALLAASGFALLAMLRVWERDGSRESARFFLAIHARMARLARVSLAWIVLGGIPRTLFYTEFEWANAAGRGQVVALGVKHVVALVLVVLGASLWIRLRRRVSEAARVAAAAPLADPRAVDA
jgi:hypothetical protein